MHDQLIKNPKTMTELQNTVPMTILVYYYLIEQQYTNLFQLLNDTNNMEL